MERGTVKRPTNLQESTVTTAQQEILNEVNHTYRTASNVQKLKWTEKISIPLPGEVIATGAHVPG